MLIRDHIRDLIIQEIKEAKYFSILCNEVTDNANLEQLSLVLWFVNKGCMIREEFLDFRCTDRITGQVISSLILKKWNSGVWTFQTAVAKATMVLQICLHKRGECKA